MAEDTFNPENIEGAASDALDALDAANANPSPFSDPNTQAQTPSIYTQSTAESYTAPTQAYDPAQQVSVDPTQQVYVDPTQQAYADPTQQVYADPAQQPYNQATYGQPAYGQPVAPQYAQGSNPGTTPMVLGILSIVFAGLIGLILSIIGLKKSGPVLAADPTNGRAKAGKVTSIIGLIFSILALIVSILMMAGLIFAANEVYENPDAFIESMEEIAALDETGQLQSELDELRQDMGAVQEGEENLQTPSSEEAAQPTESTQSGSVQSGELGKENALAMAKQYLEYSNYSHDGLIRQLEYEKFSHEDALYAADNCGADWNEQALLMAKHYLEYMAFSHQALVEQLEYEDFSSEQAKYAADNCGADWKEQAALVAKEHLEYSPYSHDGLIEQLMYDGFTQEEAEYGVEQTGL